MKRELLIVTLASFTTICLADDGQTLAPSAAAVATAATAAQRAARPRQVAIGTSASTDRAPPMPTPVQPTRSAPRLAANNATHGSAPNVHRRPASARPPAPGNAASRPPPPAPTPTDPKFASEAKWVLAGYNSDEIVYTVFVTNQDPRIIRCTTEVKGFYFENGTKLSIQDRQITTVFPNQPTRVGYWMDMDQQSGASYSVKCHPV